MQIDANPFPYAFEIGSTALDHAPGINPVHRFLGQFASAAGGGPDAGGAGGEIVPGMHGGGF